MNLLDAKTNIQAGETMTNELQSTLGNAEWLRKNEPALKELLPKTWTHAQNMNVLKIAFNLKLLGVDWRSEDEFGRIMVFLEKTGIMLREGITCKANPRSIFDDQ